MQGEVHTREFGQHDSHIDSDLHSKHITIRWFCNFILLFFPA